MTRLAANIPEITNSTSYCTLKTTGQMPPFTESTSDLFLQLSALHEAQRMRCGSNSHAVAPGSRLGEGVEVGLGSILSVTE